MTTATQTQTGTNGHAADPWGRLRQLRQAEQEAERQWREAHGEERRLKRAWLEARRRVFAYLDNGEEAEPLVFMRETKHPPCVAGVTLSTISGSE